MAANQMQDVDAARFRAYIFRRLTETEFYPWADRAHSLLVPTEVLIDLLFASLPPTAADTVLRDIHANAARGDSTARYEKQLLDHWATYVATGRMISIEEVASEDEIESLLIAGKELVPALMLLGFTLAPKRTTILHETLKEQVEGVDDRSASFLAAGCLALMEVSFQAIKREASSSSAARGPSGSAKSPAAKTNSGGNCYVATAVYGSYDCPEVWVLRRFRDDALAKRRVGRAFISVYYLISPRALRMAGPAVIAVSQPPLNAIVRTLERRGYSDLPYSEGAQS